MMWKNHSWIWLLWIEIIEIYIDDSIINIKKSQSLASTIELLTIYLHDAVYSDIYKTKNRNIEYFSFSYFTMIILDSSFINYDSQTTTNQITLILFHFLGFFNEQKTNTVNWRQRQSINQSTKPS